jgi:hypothetical protein
MSRMDAMNSIQWRRWFGAAAIGLAAVLPAQAAVVDFEDVAPGLFQGTSRASGGYNFASEGLIGFSGIDSAGGFLFGNAPANATGQFLFALNADAITMTSVDGNAFFLDQFDAAFIAPVPDLGPGILPGELHLVGDTGAGVVTESFILPASVGDGDFNFGTFYTDALRGIAVQSIRFTACIYLDDSSCSFSGVDTPPQFALDNLGVPEPGTAMLALCALALIGARRRTRPV